MRELIGGGSVQRLPFDMVLLHLPRLLSMHIECHSGISVSEVASKKSPLFIRMAVSMQDSFKVGLSDLLGLVVALI